MSRAAPRSSSTPTSSPSTKTSEVQDRFLVTGALGCLGAWTCNALAEEGTAVVGFDVGDDPARLQLVMGPDALERVTLVRGDISDFDQVDRAIEQHGITHVIHLAALQVPFC